MRFAPALIPGTFLSRENRYFALVDRGGGPEEVHVPNSGRMTELLLPGRPARIAPAFRPGRKTAWDLILIAHQGRWVSVDARIPPLLASEAIAANILRLPGFPAELRREVRHGASRFDLAGIGPGGTPALLEAKSVNLVEHGRALFPDAPTLRGARHCRHLAHAASLGCRAAILFVVQREDAEAFSPHPHVDPDFAAAVAEAHHAGVLVRAVCCRVTPESIAPLSEIPVIL